MEDFINYAIYPAIGIGLYQLSKMLANKVYCKFKAWYALRFKKCHWRQKQWTIGKREPVCRKCDN